MDEKKVKKADGSGIVIKGTDLDTDSIMKKIGQPIIGSGRFSDGSYFSFIAVLKSLIVIVEEMHIIVEMPSIDDSTTDGSVKEKSWTDLAFHDNAWHGSLGPNQGFKVTLDL